MTVRAGDAVLAGAEAEIVHLRDLRRSGLRVGLSCGGTIPRSDQALVTDAEVARDLAASGRSGALVTLLHGDSSGTLRSRRRG